MPILTQIIGISKPNKTNCKNIILNIIYNVIIYQNTNLLHFVHVSNFLLSLVQVGFELWVQSVLTYLFGCLDSRKILLLHYVESFITGRSGKSVSPPRAIDQIGFQIQGWLPISFSVLFFEPWNSGGSKYLVQKWTSPSCYTRPLNFLPSLFPLYFRNRISTLCLWHYFFTWIVQLFFF